MKRILITGADSYIGTSFENWMKQYDGYEIDTLDMREPKWSEYDFSSYDVVLHVAGLAHIKEKKSNKHLYYEINRDLAIEAATYAKESGVKQFVVMSSISVFGTKEAYITQTTIPLPQNAYGDSKLQADIQLLKLQSEKFNVAILRPPMVYGKGAKGNYPKLSKLAKITPIFPVIKNKRSMIYIENLCEFIRLIIDNGGKGIFYPQNEEYVNTTELVVNIAALSGKRVHTTKFFNILIYLLISKAAIIKKIFGDLTYDKNMSNYMDFKYCVVNFKDSIRRTEIMNEERPEDFRK